MAFFKIRKSGDAPATAPNAPQSLEGIRLRAVFRLIGSAVLVAAAVVGFPLVFDSQPRPIAVDVLIDIPDKSKVLPLVVAKTSPSVHSAAVPAPLAMEEKLPRADLNSTPVESPVSSVAVPAQKAGNPVESKSQSNLEAKLEAKPAGKSAVKPDDGAKVLALLEGKGPDSVPVAKFVVQVGAFADATRAKDARSKLESAGLKTYTQIVETKEGQRTRVRVGPFADKAEAEKVAVKIKALGLNASTLSI
jgi:DedD protein